MHLPMWLAVVLFAILGATTLWLGLILKGRNPLPFPDNGSHIFSVATPAAKEAVIELLAQYGIRERFQFNTSGVLRSIMWDGTIINCPDPEVTGRLGSPKASIALVSRNPEEGAADAAAFLKRRGFDAEVVLDAEPDLPIAFVVTNAFTGTVLTFRRHVIHMPGPQSAKG